MDLKLRTSLLSSFVFVCLLSAFSAIVFIGVKNRLVDSAEQSLRLHVAHAWEHFEFHEHEVAKELASLRTPNVPLRFSRDGKTIHDLFPAGVVDVPAGMPRYSVERAKDGHRYEVLGYFDLTSTWEYLAALRRVLFFGCFAAALLALPLSYWYTRSLLLPFRILSRKTSELGADKLTFRFQEPRQRDEYGRLVRNFNSLFARLEGSFAQMKRFATNVSHEFRTPLAIIQGESQMLLRKPREPREYQEGLETVLRQTKLLQDIINRLFFIAELERVEGHSPSVKIDVAKSIAESLTALQFMHEEGDKAVAVSLGAPGLSFIGHMEIFTSIVNNLIENALKYANREVKVSAAEDASGFLLKVEDDGPGIPPTTRDDIFDPFFKAGPSRKGHGLGLSIVKACVDAAKGTISLGESALGGLSVTVRLPQRTVAP